MEFGSGSNLALSSTRISDGFERGDRIVFHRHSSRMSPRGKCSSSIFEVMVEWSGRRPAQQRGRSAREWPTSGIANAIAGSEAVWWEGWVACLLLSFASPASEHSPLQRLERQ